MKAVFVSVGPVEINTCWGAMGDAHWAMFPGGDENVPLVHVLSADGGDESDLYWDTLCRLLAPKVRNWVHHAVSIRGGQERDMAEDILQETLCRVFRYLSRTQRHSIDIAYLERLSIVMAKNVLYDLCRKESRLMRAEGDINNINELEEEVGTFFLSIMPDLYRYPSIGPDSKGVPTRRSIMKRIRSSLAVIELVATLSGPFFHASGSMASASSRHVKVGGKSTRPDVFLPRYVQRRCVC